MGVGWSGPKDRQWNGATTHGEIEMKPHSRKNTRREFLGVAGGLSATLGLMFASDSVAQSEGSSLLPSSEQLDELIVRDADAPVTMLNLMKVKPGASGEFSTYSRAAGPIVRKYGGKIVFSARGEQPLLGGEDWDMIILVEYPSRKAFVDMMRSDEYQAISQGRENSLERAVLYATKTN